MKDYATPSYATYPDGYPQPLMSGYSFEYRQNTASSKMQNGWTRKRGMTKYPFRTVQLSFSMTRAEFDRWHHWVHAHGFKWFTMAVQTDRTAASSSNLDHEVIRFTSAVTWAYKDWNTIVASVSAEIEADLVDPAPVDVPTDGGVTEV